MENPIRFNDILQENGEIEALIKKATDLDASLERIRVTAEDLKKSLAGMSGASGASGIGEAAGDADRLAKAQKELQFALSVTGQQLAEVKKRISETNTESKIMSEFVNSSKESYKELVAELKLLTESYKSKSKEQRLSSDEGKAELQSIIALKTQIKELDASMKLSTESTKEKVQVQKEEKIKLTELQIAQNNLTKARSQDSIEIAKLKLQTAEANNVTKLNAIIATTTEGSYARLSAQYSLNKIALNKKSEAEIASSGSLTQLRDDTNAMYIQMSKLQEATGKHTLSVGNYKKGWDGLGNSASQITRELPSLAMSANMFFLAISNNIPIMADEINRLKIRNQELNAEGIKTPAVWKSVMLSFMSFNTIMMVGVALLTMYGGTVVKWIASLFGAEKAVNSVNVRMKELAKTIENNSGEYTKNMVLLSTLRKEWQGLGGDLQKQEEFIAKNSESFKTLGVEITTSQQAETLFVTGTDLFVRSMQDRAKALAAASLAQDEYKKQMKAIAEDEARQDELVKNGIGFWKDLGFQAVAFGKTVATSPLWTLPSTLAGVNDDLMQNYVQSVTDYKFKFKAEATEAEALALRYTKMSEDLNKSANKKQKDSGINPLGGKEQEAYIKAAQDLQNTAAEASIAAISNEERRKREEILYSYKTKEDDLKKDNANYIKNKEVIDKTIVNYEIQKNRELSELAKDYSDKRDKEKEDETKKEQKFQDEKAKIIAESEKAIAATSDDTYQLKRDKLNQQYEQDLKDAKGKSTTYSNDPEIVAAEAARIVAIKTKLANDLKAIDNDESKSFSDNQKKVTDEKIKSFDLQADYDQQLFDLEETTENEKTKMKIEAEKKRILMLLELNKSGELQLSDQQIEIYNKTLDKLSKASKDADKKFEKKDIYEIMGIKLNDDEKSSMNESIGYATGAIKDLANSYVESAQAAVRASADRVSSAEDALNREKDAKANGYAYNTELAQKELDAAKKQQDKALKQEEKAKKAQILIDSALQTSSMITATANLWKVFSAIPIVGVGLAIAATALMWGAFTASKAKALSVTKSSSAAKNYGEGGMEILEGGSHASGNDIPIGQTNDGKRRNAEGGEAMIIINKRKTAKYKHQLPDIVNALNKGIFEQKYMSAFSGNVNVSSHVDLRNVEKGINTLTKQGERKIYTDGKGRIVEQYKNLRRVIA